MIVGAGPAGLTAAVVAAEAGHNVRLLERSGRVGGMAASITVSGQRVDLGSHRLHPSASLPVRQLLEELLGADLQTRPRNGRINIGGRWVGFPLSAVDLARRLPPRFIAAAARDTALAPFRQEQTDTYDEVIRAGLGPAVLDWFYGPYAEKLWGCAASELHGDIARRRVAMTSALQLAKKLLRSATGQPPVFLYPRHGYGQVVDALRERAVAGGVEIITDVRVTRIEPGRDHVAIEWVDAASSTATHTTDRVFWTASPGHLADVVDGGPPPNQRPTHRAMVLVYLTFDCDQYTPFDAHYFPSVDVLPARVSEPKNYRDGDDPDGQTVLCAEIACDVGDEIWSSPPDALAQRVVDALDVTGVRSPTASPTTPTGVHVERLPSVYPVITPADVAPLEQLANWAASLDGVTVLGRQGLVVADNLHHVMDMGLAAAASLGASTQGAARWDAAAWSEALARFEQHVVED